VQQVSHPSLQQRHNQLSHHPAAAKQADALQLKRSSNSVVSRQLADSVE
jgi:hypothetical protein